MIPESSSAGTIDLYRATDFPSGWRREATLVADVVASDARWSMGWALVDVRHRARRRRGSPTRSGYGRAAFRGPWTAHPRNPVLIDIGSARPAGPMLALRGALIAPCRIAAVATARPWVRPRRPARRGRLAQTLETVVRPGAGWAGRRLHTYNAAGGFEFIDGSAFAPRWRALPFSRRPRLRRRRPPP